ncbi:MAG: hypothetical protein Q8K78_02350 [Planctomycetaceae bacterium]|nr:hypothetical protein [Planctomycetaceae bacterium]
MTLDDRKLTELTELRERVQRLEAELSASTSPDQWPPTGFYWAYYATTGFLLGMFGAMASLMINVIGAPIVGKSPLELIRVYLTFPLGEQALRLASQQTDVYAIGDGVMLAIGCCLYLATGMVLGVPFFAVLVRLTEGKSTGYRLGVATVLSLILWTINFYGILSWLQPALIGGNWITDPAILPTWVAAVTHLIFGWTLALLYPLGRFQVYHQPTAMPGQRED